MTKLRDALLGKRTTKTEPDVATQTTAETAAPVESVPVMARTAVDVIYDKTDGFYYEVIISYDPITMSTVGYVKNRLSKTQSTAIYNVKKNLIEKILNTKRGK